MGDGMAAPKIYLFTDNNEECIKAEKLLHKTGIPYKKIDVTRNGIRGWMLVEFGTMQTPMITTPDAVIVGIKNIEKYFKSSLKIV